MNITKAFVEYMKTLDLENIYIGGVPQNAPDKSWWVLSSGGNTETKAETGEKIKNYIIQVFYRSIDAEDVYDTLHNFEGKLNKKHCVQLNGYETVEIQAIIFPADQDLDVEDRTVGLVQVGLRIYTS